MLMGDFFEHGAVALVHIGHGTQAAFAIPEPLCQLPLQNGKFGDFLVNDFDFRLQQIANMRTSRSVLTLQ